jgi:ELWxxDGT repeat protein
LGKDIHPGPIESNPHLLFSAGDRLYFIARDNRHGYELWQSDGTAIGTAMIMDLNPTTEEAFQWREFAKFYYSHGVLYFTADDGRTGIELWALMTPPPLQDEHNFLPLVRR